MTARERARRRREIETGHPHLRGSGWRVHSPPDADYNCFAFAASDTSRWWEPFQGAGYYWPQEAPMERTVEAFVAAYGAIGYTRASDASFEVGSEKIAIYADEFARPRHAARQTRNGRWLSKLGKEADILHKTLHDLEDGLYGRVAVILRRPIQRRRR